MNHKHMWEVSWTNGVRWIYRCWRHDLLSGHRCNEIGYGVPDNHPAAVLVDPGARIGVPR